MNKGLIWIFCEWYCKFLSIFLSGRSSKRRLRLTLAFRIRQLEAISQLTSVCGGGGYFSFHVITIQSANVILQSHSPKYNDIVLIEHILIMRNPCSCPNHMNHCNTQKLHTRRTEPKFKPQPSELLGRRTNHQKTELVQTLYMCDHFKMLPVSY